MGASNLKKVSPVGQLFSIPSKLREELVAEAMSWKEHYKRRMEYLRRDQPKLRLRIEERKRARAILLRNGFSAGDEVVQDLDGEIKKLSRLTLKVGHAKIRPKKQVNLTGRAIERMNRRSESAPPILWGDWPPIIWENWPPQARTAMAYLLRAQSKNGGNV